MCPVRAGQVLFELGGIPENMAYKALKRASRKMPLKTTIVKLIF